MKQDKIFKIRHSLAHVLAMAVLKKFPEAKLAIGPVIDNGFYYDFLLPAKISDADLPALENIMREIVKQNIEFKKKVVPRAKALDITKEQNQPFKTELINDLPDDETISFYSSGSFNDLCRGPHVKATTEINTEAFKLISVAGAYWRGDEKREMLTRIYGVAFATKEELEKYLTIMEQAKERDHRKLGKELDLFTFSDLVGPGLPLWTPHGMIIREQIDNFVWELRKVHGYQKVEIPHITKKDLFVTSGHWDKFSDELFKCQSREGHLFALKPMNCPFHTQIFDRNKWSYRDMPQRYANTTMCYRDEQTGELSGLSRLRSFTQDDAHVFCRESQTTEEALKIWDIIQAFYKQTGFKLKVRLSLRDPKQPEKYKGSEELWLRSEEQLRNIIQQKKVKFTEALGEAAFYGPKIDFLSHDSLGREWQVATIQIDRSMPDSFNLHCINEKGEEERIVMIHAAIAGSLERFMSVLIEHLGGNFPTWLAPVQIKILTVNSSHGEFAHGLAQEFAKAGLRIAVDDSSETLGNKIRKSAKDKIPYVLVIGDKEMNCSALSVRVRGSNDLLNIAKADFIRQVKNEVKKRKLKLLK